MGRRRSPIYLPPCRFCKFLKAGRQAVTASPLVITRENEPLDQLYFITEVRVIIEKGGHRVASDAKAFIGEILRPERSGARGRQQGKVSDDQFLNLLVVTIRAAHPASRSQRYGILGVGKRKVAN